MRSKIRGWRGAPRNGNTVDAMGGIHYIPSQMYDVGLTLGKFAPFHRGHQYLIETALGETRHLIVVVYNARTTTDIPLSLRARWIRTLYPEVEVIEARDSPEDAGEEPEVGKKHEEFLRSLLGGRKIDAFYSSESYGERASRVLGCANRLVDPRRVAVPVSATMIRTDPLNYSEYLHQIVFEDLRKGVADSA